MNKDFVYIEDLSKHVGERVTVKGWVSQKRSSGKIRFLVIRDGSGYLQCIAFHKDVSPELLELAGSVPHESSVSVSTNSARG